MTRDEIVTALRCCASSEADCKGNCAFFGTSSPNEDCSQKKNTAAADLIENQQRHIEALMKANDSLKDAIARRDKQIEDMKQGMAQLAKAVAVKEENNGTTYEDTGLTPGDIKELLDMAVSKTDKVLRLKEELQGAKNTAEQYAAINETLFDSNMKLGADRKDLINELCQYCGKYKYAHEGACAGDGCRWRDM